MNDKMQLAPLVWLFVVVGSIPDHVNSTPRVNAKLKGGMKAGGVIPK